MNAFLSEVWRASLYGGAAIVVAFVAMPLIRRFLGARAAFSFWLFPLIALLSPWAIKSPVGVLPKSDQIPAVVVTVFSFTKSPEVKAPPGEEKPSSLPPLPWLFLAWLAGAGTLSALLAIRLCRTQRLIGNGVNITKKFPASLLPARVRIIESRDIQSPAMSGVIFPKILLPIGWESRIAPENLDWILAHESGHIRRGDMLWCWAFQFVRIVHWFNPLVWIAERVSRIDMEMACDEWVLSHKGSDRMGYGDAILNSVALPSEVSYLRAGMAESRAGLARRIKHLAQASPRGFWAVVVVILLGTLALCLLSPQAKKTNTNAPANSPSDPIQYVEIESRFIEVPSAVAQELFESSEQDSRMILDQEKLAVLLRKLGQSKGADILTAPKVTVKNNQKAVIQVSREFSYPNEFTPAKVPGDKVTPASFEMESLGVQLGAEPMVTNSGQIICTLSPKVVEFLGFMNYGGERPKQAPSDDPVDAALRPGTSSDQAINQPIFRTREMQSTVVLNSGDTVILGGLSKDDDRKLRAAMDSTPHAPKEKTEHVLYAVVTVTLADGKKMSSAPAEPLPSPTVPVDRTPGNIPSGVPVPGKPGFITSPYAFTGGYVDVRGVPSGSEVKCPYTGKLFLVP